MILYIIWQRGKKKISRISTTTRAESTRSKGSKRRSNRRDRDWNRHWRMLGRLYWLHDMLLQYVYSKLTTRAAEIND